MTSPAYRNAPPADAEWVAGAGDHHRLRQCILQAIVPPGRRTTGLVVAGFVVIVSTVDVYAGREVAAPALWALVIALVLAMVCLRQTVGRHLAPYCTPGTRWTITYGYVGLTLCRGGAVELVDYSGIRSVRAGRNRTIVLRRRRFELPLALPGELCPPDAVAFLTAAGARRH